MIWLYGSEKERMRMMEEHQTYQTDMHLDSCEYKVRPFYIHHEKLDCIIILVRNGLNDTKISSDKRKM